jgi:glucose/arabinose dehydrogenase
VVATKLAQPTGLVVLPDGTAVVGERRTGRLLRVQPVAGKPVTVVQKLTGLDASGDGGLLDLALSPTYRQDGLLYAYVTTATDNRVVHFTLGATPTAVVTGIPKGRTGNAGRIAFDATGALLIGTGAAGNPALVANPKSLAGKILRADDIGAPLPDNPTAGSIIFATGLASVDGLCVDPINGTRIAVSAGSGSSVDEINVIRAGREYGWPAASSKSVAPAARLPGAAAGGAGCAIADGRLAVATTTGRAIASAQVSAAGVVGRFDTALAGKYGRLRTIVAGSDGALWLTTANRDPLGKPTAADDRVIRLPASAAGGSSVL